MKKLFALLISSYFLYASSEFVKIETDFSTFFIGKYEVTKKEFKEFVNDTQYITDAQKSMGNIKGCFTYIDKEWKYRDGYNWKNTGYKQTDIDPIVCVSYNDIQAYIQWLNKKTNETYRLPTSKEWQYVAKANTTTKWSFGDDEKELKNYAWYNKTSDYKTHPVGQKKPNIFGIYDLYGNVYEWTEDLSNSKDTKLLHGGCLWTDIYWTNSTASFKLEKFKRSSGAGFRLVKE